MIWIDAWQHTQHPKTKAPSATPTVRMLRWLDFLVWFDRGRSKFRPPGWCKECLGFTLGSEWNTHVGHMFDLLIFPRVLTFVHRLPLNHRRKIPTNESSSFLPSQPPVFPFLLTFYPFSFVLRAMTINT